MIEYYLTSTFLTLPSAERTMLRPFWSLAICTPSTVKSCASPLATSALIVLMPSTTGSTTSRVASCLLVVTYSVHFALYRKIVAVLYHHVLVYRSSACDVLAHFELGLLLFAGTWRHYSWRHRDCRAVPLPMLRR